MGCRACGEGYPVENWGSFDLEVIEVFEVYLIIYKKIHEIKENEKSRVTDPGSGKAFRL